MTRPTAELVVIIKLALAPLSTNLPCSTNFFAIRSLSVLQPIAACSAFGCCLWHSVDYSGIDIYIYTIFLRIDICIDMLLLSLEVNFIYFVYVGRVVFGYCLLFVEDPGLMRWSMNWMLVQWVFTFWIGWCLYFDEEVLVNFLFLGG